MVSADLLMLTGIQGVEDTIIQPVRQILFIRHKGNRIRQRADDDWYGRRISSGQCQRSLLSPTVSERFRAVLLGNSHICSECSISEVRANFRNSSEFFRAYSDQFRATGRNHSDMIRTYSEQIPSKFRSYPSVLIRAIPNKDE